MRRGTVRLAIAAAAVCAGGCSALIGTRDLDFEPTATDGDGGEGGPEAVSGGDDTPGDDASATTTDGGAPGVGPCGVSPCDDQILAQGLPLALGAYVDGTNVYATTFDGASVIAVPKSGGAVQVLASGHTGAHGIAGDGTSLYWTDQDLTFDDAGAMGGLWKCTAASCAATKKLLTPAYTPANVEVAGGFAVYAEVRGDTVTRVATDGTQLKSFNVGTGPFAAAADTSFVYYQRVYPKLQRQPVGGGTTDDFASFDPLFQEQGDIVLDGDRVFWTVTDANNHGQCASAPKSPLGAPEIAYATAGELPAFGLAVDDTWVYWGSQDEDGNGDPTGGGAKLYACKKTGCEGDPILLLESATSGHLAVDADAIYLVESGVPGAAGGKIHKLAKKH